MEIKCLNVQSGQKRSLSVDKTVGSKSSVQDAMKEDEECKSSSSSNSSNIKETANVTTVLVSTPPVTFLDVTTSQMDRMSQHSATTESVD